ncbi:hypothetical protein M409DRAFT_59164 [Zasmidium cellare ATCC 36951]|uniref:Uncharacterized protein n=1 Tax=Zasmidium cellare ATCC 36951 TaxID=1080233 RepID=A0A6A6C6F6_ZASCE|nr:uncharacterized protein M409DRAFT_59164 [Zasmidium cellare ATCC 36951]KAF2161462.1 hypothetical protein M409DRAFT_59164 [Zasmidium cellare ATCC 36951]
MHPATVHNSDTPDEFLSMTHSLATAPSSHTQPTSLITNDMHSEGVDVYITGPDGNAITEHENKFLKDNAAYSGRVFSKLICEEPARETVIHLKFDCNFQLYEADGVAIQICANDIYPDKSKWDFKQLFWIDKADIGLIFVFDQVKLFHRTSITRWEIQMPAETNPHNARTAETAWIEDIDTNSGCITVFVRRGTFSNRTGFMQAREDSEPTWEQYQNMDKPKVIRNAWFTPLEGERGEHTAFQFKNMRVEDIGPSLARSTNPTASDSRLMSTSSHNRLAATHASKRLSRGSPKRSIKRSCPGSSKDRNIGHSARDVIFKAKEKIGWPIDDDDEDDEEVHLPAPIQDVEAAIKQEEDAITTCAAPSAPLRDRESPGTLERRAQYIEQLFRRPSSETDGMSTPAPAALGVEADDELLRLRLEENLIRQQLRKNELQRAAKK